VYEDNVEIWKKAVKSRFPSAKFSITRGGIDAYLGSKDDGMTVGKWKGLLGDTQAEYKGIVMGVSGPANAAARKAKQNENLAKFNKALPEICKQLTTENSKITEIKVVEVRKQRGYTLPCLEISVEFKKKINLEIPSGLHQDLIEIKYKAAGRTGGTYQIFADIIYISAVEKDYAKMAKSLSKFVGQ
jgi:hypothetical protein